MPQQNPLSEAIPWKGKPMGCESQPPMVICRLGRCEAQSRCQWGEGVFDNDASDGSPPSSFLSKNVDNVGQLRKAVFGVATAQPNARTSKQRDLVLSITAVLNLKSDFGRMHLRGHSIEITLFDISVRLLTFSQKPTMGGSRR